MPILQLMAKQGNFRAFITSSRQHMLSHLSETDLSKRWTISRRTLQRWRCLGIGPSYIRLGRRIVYMLAEVEAFEAANRTRPVALQTTG